MKKTLIFISLILATSLVKAQGKTEMNIRLSYNQFGLGGRYYFQKTPIWSEINFGLGNEDIDRKFNDWVFDARMGIPVWKLNTSAFYIAAKAGIYIPENDYYKAITPTIGCLIGYKKDIGKQKRQSIFAEAGYNYGKRQYTQNWSNENISIATIDQFKVSPVTFSLGYSYRF